MRWRNIKGDDIGIARPLGVLYMEDDKTDDRTAFVGDQDACVARFGEASHGAAGKAKRRLKALHVQRVHRGQVVCPIGA